MREYNIDYMKNGQVWTCLLYTSFSDGSTITYTYGADGTKLRTVHKIGRTTTTTDYCGNVIYENGTQKLLLTEEGYINLTGTQQYHYYLKDHQGNNRVVINQSGTVEETNHYYPFGGVFPTILFLEQIVLVIFWIHFLMRQV